MLGVHERSKDKDDNRKGSSPKSDSESDADPLSQELDQIGRYTMLLDLNLPSINRDTFKFNNLPSFELSKLQDVSKEISRTISNYITYNENGMEDKKQMINSLKTGISTRIQMMNIMNDLNLGFNLSTAIERLQPLKDIVHETILLPVEDGSDFEDNTSYKEEETTEPAGVHEIVNSDQPLVTDIVIPENRHRRRRRRRIIVPDCDDNSTTASDLDNIEGLTGDEIRSLTHLESLDDFYKENLLRKKIKDIQKMSNIDQKSKNKLVTRLMMGNYYKYVDEKLKKENVKLNPKLKKQKLFLDENDSDNRDFSPVVSNLGYGLDEGDEDEELEKEKNISTENQMDANTDLVSSTHETDKYIVDSQEGSSCNDDSGSGSESDVDEVALTEEDKRPTFHDAPFNSMFGCQHYQRKCKIECPTCFKWFTCRFCHDSEIDSHKLVRSAVKHILCMNCQTPQVPHDNYCIECGVELANYFCSTCVLYDDDSTKDIYHCGKCGICRLGLGLGKDYFHCDECNICLSIDLKERHKCLNNTTHCNCPICNEYLFTSVQKVVFMNCGHSIHQSCYEELSKHSYKCPVCKKTVVNMTTQFRILDQEILQSPLPAPYSMWRCIVSCNDCKGKSNAPYHVLGLKCKYCKSYNTNQLKLIKPEEEEEDDFDASRITHSSTDQLVSNLEQMRLMQNNLPSNFLMDDRPYNHDYEGDVNADVSDNRGVSDESSAEEKAAISNFFNLTHLSTSFVRSLSTANSTNMANISYVRSLLQSFVNNAISAGDASMSSTTSGAEASDSDIDNIGGL